MLKDEVMELRRRQQLLDATLEQVAEQAAKIEREAYSAPAGFVNRLVWVQNECDNAEGALYELRQAVQALETVTKRMEGTT